VEPGGNRRAAEGEHEPAEDRSGRPGMRAIELSQRGRAAE
jgi:hypothetical protein